MAISNYCLKILKNQLLTFVFILFSSVFLCFGDEKNIDQKVKELIAKLSSQNGKQKFKTIEKLADIGPRAKTAIPTLLTILKEDPDPEMRHIAAIALGAIQDREALPTLIEALKDKHYLVRYAVIVELGIIGRESETVFLLLKDTLKNDSAWNVREIAASALGKVGEEKAIPCLIEALKDRDISVKNAAAYTLGEMGEKAESAIPALIKALEDTEISIDSRGPLRSANLWYPLAVSAAHALGKMGTKAASAIPALTECLKNENEWVRKAAAEALEKIKGQK